MVHVSTLVLVQRTTAHLVHVAGQAQQHGEQLLVEVVHGRQGAGIVHHLGTLPDHVDHQAVEQLTRGHLQRAQSAGSGAGNKGLLGYKTASCLLWGTILELNCGDQFQPL